jgi:hypothetical protein
MLHGIFGELKSSGLKEAKLNHCLLVFGRIPSCGLCWTQNLECPINSKKWIIYVKKMFPTSGVNGNWGFNTKTEGSNYLQQEWTALLNVNDNFHTTAFTPYNLLVLVNLCAWNLSGNQRDIAKKGTKRQWGLSTWVLITSIDYSIMEPPLAMLLLQYVIMTCLISDVSLNEFCFLLTTNWWLSYEYYNFHWAITRKPWFSCSLCEDSICPLSKCGLSLLDKTIKIWSITLSSVVIIHAFLLEFSLGAVFS